MEKESVTGLRPLIDRLDINDSQRKDVMEFYDLVRHGSKFINLHVRVDGSEYHFDADWLKNLLRYLDEGPRT
jgi:hypothetical protein